MIAPVVSDKASDLLPASEASFQELRAGNAALRASNANLKTINSQEVAVLEEAEAKLKLLYPVSPSPLLCHPLPCHSPGQHIAKHGLIILWYGIPANTCFTSLTLCLAGLAGDQRV